MRMHLPHRKCPKARNMAPARACNPTESPSIDFRVDSLPALRVEAHLDRAEVEELPRERIVEHL